MTLLSLLALAVMGVMTLAAAQETVRNPAPAAQIAAVLFASLSTVCGAAAVFLILRPFLGH